MTDKPKKWYYYAGERQCMKDPDAVDAIGVGTSGHQSGGLTIDLIRFNEHRAEPRYTMKLSVHCDEWQALTACRDVLDVLAVLGIPSGQMNSVGPFYALRTSLEELGYKNLGLLRE